MDRAGLGDQLLLVLGVVRVGDAAVDGAHDGALLLIEEADALGALLGYDLVDILADGWMGRPVVLPRAPPLVDRRVRTLRLAGAAVDAFRGDHRRHAGGPYNATCAMTTRNAASQTERPATGRGAAPRTASATRVPSSRKVRLAGCDASATMMGRPRSPPSRIAGTRGIRASSGTPNCAASRSPPPAPNTVSSVPQAGQT